MIIKQVASDFLVDELYDIESFKQKEDGRDYFYFILKKTEYNQLRAIDIIAQSFNVSKKQVHFAGTKDKVGITTQVISIFNLNEENLQKNIDYVNNEVKDIDVEFIGKFPGRINLGDNLGNKFSVTVRDLSDDDIKVAKNNLNKIIENGALNYFDSQRFGFANNSHIVGKYILQNKPELAVKEILTSMPKNPSEDLKIFVSRVEESWEEIKNQNVEIIDTLIEICPRKFQDYTRMLAHLKKAKNDFPGSFRTLMKKLRTLYIHAFQSHIFNVSIRELSLAGTLSDFEKLELINNTTDFSKIDSKVLEIVEKVLVEENVTKEDLQLKSWPELKSKYEVLRDTVVKPNNLELVDEGEDELNSDKKKITAKFELGSGQYATNIVKQLFHE